MIHQPQLEAKKYIPPEIITVENVKDGTEVRCLSCGRDLFGIFNDGELQIKYRGRNIQFLMGSIEITCRSCSYVTPISLRATKVNVQVYNNDELVLEITEAALKLATEHNIAPRNIVGTGKDGRIVLGDVRKFLTEKD